jgi:hypothetical protein
MAERGGSPKFEFPRAMVVGFRWGLLLRDHNDEGNVFMLTLIGRERQRNPATVRWLGRCLATVRAASIEALAPRTCAKVSSSSLLASRLANCSERWWKTLIWWLPRVRRVHDLRPETRTICSTIYRVGSNAIGSDLDLLHGAHPRVRWATPWIRPKIPILNNKSLFFSKSVL